MGMLDDKVAIITGATSGIGRRIAEVFVAEGAQIVVGARREDEGKQLERELGKGTCFISTDVSNAKQVKAMVDCAMDSFGRIDCLVNNAGSPSPMVSIVDVDMDNYEQVMAINVRGVMLGMKMVVPHMLRQGSGSIINISSGAATRVSYTAHTYAASKAAVTHLTRSVAAEVGANGIRVNSIATTRSCPWINDARSLARKTAALAISSVTPERWIGCKGREHFFYYIVTEVPFLVASVGTDGIQLRALLYGKIKEALDRSAN